MYFIKYNFSSKYDSTKCFDTFEKKNREAKKVQEFLTVFSVKKKLIKSSCSIELLIKIFFMFLPYTLLTFLIL